MGSWEKADLLRFNLYNSAFFMAQCVPLYPLELIKTRLQVLDNPAHTLRTDLVAARSHLLASVGEELRGVRCQFREIVRAAGVQGVFRGFFWYAVPMAVAECVYYTAYNTAKHRLGDWGVTGETLSPFLAGFMAEFVITPFNVPTDMITQRLMILPPTVKQSGREVLRDIRRQRGASDLFRGTKLHLLTYCTASACWLGSYELAKRAIGDRSAFHQPDSLTLRDHLVHIASGLVAGVVSVVVSNPIDVIKTRFQVAGALGSEHVLRVPAATAGADATAKRPPRVQSSSLIAGLRTLVREEGVRGLTRGVLPRALTAAPQSAVALTLYEIAFSSSLELDDG